MYKLIARVATTGIVKQGSVETMITKEAIESIPDQVNGEKAIPYTVNHNPFCMPIGKAENAWIKKYKDGHAAMVQVHIEDTYSTYMHDRSDAELVRLDFEGSPKPFLQKKYDDLDSRPDVLTVDLSNFAEPQDYDAFASEIRRIDNAIVCDGSIRRHSLGPDPLIQIEIANPALVAALTVGAFVVGRAVKFVRYTIDETLRKTADDISDVLSNRLKSFLRAYRRFRPHDKRPSIAKVIIPAKPVLILLIKTEDKQELSAIELSGLVGEMEQYGDILQEANSVTFIHVGKGDWRFLYCTTQSGKVIGSLECYEETKEIADHVGSGISLGGYATIEPVSKGDRCAEEGNDGDGEECCSRE